MFALSLRVHPRPPGVAFVLLEKRVSRDDETLRWPPHLPHAEIVRRLVRLRQSARSEARELSALGEFFAGVEEMTSAQIAASVVAAMTWVQDNPHCPSAEEQLQILAMNLKNLD